MADHHQHHPGPVESDRENYTGSELPYRALYISGIALFVISVVFAVALIPMRVAFVGMADRAGEKELVPDSERPAGALLQPSPEGDWKVWEATMKEHMTSYGWHDRAAGVARIPVDRAIRLVLDQGLVRSEPGAPSAFPEALAPSAAPSASGGHGDVDAHDARNSPDAPVEQSAGESQHQPEEAH